MAAYFRRPIALLLLPVALALSTAAAQPPIEQQMTPEQFRAAGLEKLSAQELANLNAWLNNTLEVETDKAAKLAKEKIETENRGFLSFGRTDPIESNIVGEFRGFGRGRSWTLTNGQVWTQVDDATLAGVRTRDPAVKISPSVMGNTWYMAIEGYNSRAKVQRVK